MEVIVGRGIDSVNQYKLPKIFLRPEPEPGEYVIHIYWYFTSCCLFYILVMTFFHACAHTGSVLKLICSIN